MQEILESYELNRSDYFTEHIKKLLKNNQSEKAAEMIQIYKENKNGKKKYIALKQRNENENTQITKNTQVTNILEGLTRDQKLSFDSQCYYVRLFTNTLHYSFEIEKKILTHIITYNTQFYRRPKHSYIPNIIYIVCYLENNYYYPHEIYDVCKLQRDSFYKNNSKLVSTFNIKGFTDYIPYLTRIVKDVKYIVSDYTKEKEKKLYEKSKEILEKTYTIIKEKNIDISGKKTSCLCAGAILIASQSMNVDITRSDISKISYNVDYSIKKAYIFIAKIIGFDIDVKISKYHTTLDIHSIDKLSFLMLAKIILEETNTPMNEIEMWEYAIKKDYTKKLKNTNIPSPWNYFRKQILEHKKNNLDSPFKKILKNGEIKYYIEKVY
jgi:hypothetical protein